MKIKKESHLEFIITESFKRYIPAIKNYKFSGKIVNNFNDEIFTIELDNQHYDKYIECGFQPNKKGQTTINVNYYEIEILTPIEVKNLLLILDELEDKMNV